MTIATKLIEDSIATTRKSQDMVENCVDNLIPNYFFIGFCLGGEYKNIEKLKEGLGNKEALDGIMELYNKGKENMKKIILGSTCSKCGKEVVREDNVKFCKYCGEKL